MASLRSPTGKKLFNPIQDPPTASSSEISDSSSEENEPKIPSTQTLKSPSAVSAAAKPDSGSDSGSETGSDSESEPPEKALPVTAVKSKKKEGNDSPAVKSVKKRGNEAGTSTAKRAKKVSGDDEEKKSGEDNKKPHFQRLWSEEDEITLLQGMIDFKAETGTNPSDDMNGFYDKVKKFISFDASKSQFSDKIRGLKKNYFAGRKKSVESSHDKKCLGLAKYIWGSDGLGLESDVVVKPKKVESDVVVKPKKVESDVVVKPKKVESDVKPKKVVSDVVVKPKKVESDVVVKPKKVESDVVVKPKKVESDVVVKPKKVESDKVEKNKEVKGSGEIVESAVKSSLVKSKNVEKKKEDKVSVVEPAANSSLVKSKKVEKKKEDNGSADVVKSNGKGMKVEADKEEVILGGDLEKSFLVRSIVSLGVDESSVKRKWSKVPLESKKRIEKKFKLVGAKEYESLLLKTDLLNEVTSVLSEAV